MHNNVFKCSDCELELKDIIAICNHMYNACKNTDRNGEDQNDTSETNPVEYYECSCKKLFKSLVVLSRHVHIDHIRAYNNRYNINRNIKKKSKDYKCYYCEFRSKNIATICYHIQHTHEKKKDIKPKPHGIDLYRVVQPKYQLFVCTECPVNIHIYGNKKYSRHMRNDHPGALIDPNVYENQTKIICRCKVCFTCFKSLIECANHIKMNHDYQTLVQTNENIANDSSSDSENDIDQSPIIIKSFSRQEESMEGYQRPDGTTY